MEIALAGWSLHHRFRAPEEPLALLDFPAVAREEFGLAAVELNSPFFASREPDYLEDLNARAREYQVRLLGLAVDDTGDPSAEDDGARRHSIAQIKEWFPVAKALGLPYFRANTGGYGRGHHPGTLARCIRSFLNLAEEAARWEVAIVVENHGGLSADPDRVVALVEAVGGDWTGTLPDFGNFPDELRYEGLRKLAPFARGAHAKTYEFGPDGEETRIDIGRCLRILREAGYRGHLSIEYEGKGDDHEGVLKSKALLEKHLRAAGGG